MNNGNQTQSVLSSQSEAEVSITNKGFSPQIIYVKAGTAVTFTNLDESPHIVASDPYPSNTILPDLLSPSLLNNETYSFTFEKTGTFTYHDDLNPYMFKGTVFVK